MKKIVLIVAVLLMIVASAYVYIINFHSTFLWHFTDSWRDSTGVITVSERNTVYMNLTPGTNYYLDSGQLTIHEGKHIHVEYAIDAGTLNLAFRTYVEGSDALRVNSPVFDDLQNSGEIFGKSGISGKGTLDFDAAPGTYEVYFRTHEVIGTATVTEKAN